jgi:hypothetical protein
VKTWHFVLIAFILALILGGFSWEQLRPKPGIPIVQHDTTHIKGDSIKVTVTRPVYVEKIVYREMPVPTDDSPCWPLLRAAYADLDSMAQQNWYLSELETEAQIETPTVKGRIGWSTPRFLNNGNEGFFYDLESIGTTTNTFPEPATVGFFSRFGYGLQGGAGWVASPMGSGPGAYVGIGVHFDMKGVF